MAGGPIEIWNEWATQILLLLSFTLQVVLFVFAGTRRRVSSTILTILLWLAYLMADSTAVYALGHLSISRSPGKQNLAVFWAPFLLVHLGSQDTITAYALEDNQLWPRHLLTLGVQASGVAYVLYKYITELPTSLRRATVLMFIVGLMKYGERIWALRSARLDSIRNSFNRKKHITIHGALRGPGLWTDDDGLLLMAHVMLPICKGAMVDQPVDLYGMLKPRHWVPCRLDLNRKDRCRVVEFELALMYDVLYTKAAVIYTWYGYLSRLVWPLITIAAFLVFQLSGTKYGYSRMDVVVTYILLVGAFLLDMASLFRALGSTWTCSFLLTRGWCKLGHVIMSLRRYLKAGGGNPGWSGSVGQFNLLQFCSRQEHRLPRMMQILGSVELALSKRLYAETLVISKDVKELVLQHVWEVLEEAQDAANGMELVTCDFFRPAALMFDAESWGSTSQRRMALDEALGSGAELQEAILSCHVLTDVFLLCSGTKDASSSSTYVQGIKALSNYMVFVVVMHPDTIVGLELRSLYESAQKYLEILWNVHEFESPYSSNAPQNERFANIVRDNPDSYHIPNIIVTRGALYARLLLDLVDMSNPDKSGIISSYEDHEQIDKTKLKSLLPDLESSCRDGVFDIPKALVLIFDAWVRLLISLSVRRSRDAHARQINRGSELTTVVWLMVEHAEVFQLPHALHAEAMNPQDAACDA